MTSATQPIDMFPASGLENSPHLFTRQNDAPDDWEATVDVDRVPHGQAEETERNIVLGAFERARSLVSEKAQALSQNSKRIGAVATASIALTIGYPAAQSIVDKAPQAHAAEVDYGTGGYPWADDTPLEIGPNGFPIRDCTGWVAWKLQSTERDPNRLFNADVTGEIIDNNPAIGAAAGTADGRHIMYVEDLTDTHITVSDYNGYGGRYKYGIRTLERSNPEVQSWTFTHFELPAPQKPAEETENPSNNKESSPLLDAQRIKANKIDVKTALGTNTYIQSKNKQYSVLLDKKGNLVAYDKKSDYSKVWESKTSGKGGNKVQVKKSKSSNSLVIAKGNKKVKSWNIGNATKVAIGNDGTLAGYTGNKRVWVADELAAVSRVARQSMSKIASVRQKALGR